MKEPPGTSINYLINCSLLLFPGSFIRDVAQSGSVRRSGRRGRWFESSHPDTLEVVLKRQPLLGLEFRGLRV
jgi:hypothetical protein